MIGPAIALLFSGGALLAQAEPYAWPLDLPRELTSSFGEYRAGRYHMGIDLRTGPIGKNVYAADDGYVIRIGCSPYGYGKAIYLLMEDGTAAIYAHLDEFAPPIDEHVRKAQHAARNYTVALELKPDELPIRRGQLIAKSGQTGIGVPHLHYELRKGIDAINPRLLGVTWPDDTAPVFRKAAIIPLEPESTVNGDVLPVIRDVRVGADGRFTVDVVRIAGPFVVAIDVYDPAAGGSKLGVYRLATALNGRPKFEITHDRLSYENINDGAAAYEPALLDRGQFLLQWRKPGNESEIYLQNTDDGRMELLTSPSEVTITAEDFHGNHSELVIPARPDTSTPLAGPKPNTLEPGNNGRGEVSFEYTGVLFVVTVRFDANEIETPTLHVAGATPDRVPFRRIGPREFRVAYKPNESFADAQVSVEHPRVDVPSERVVFLTRDGQLPQRWIDFGAIRFWLYEQPSYAMLPLRVKQVDAVSAQEELTFVGPAFDFWPSSAIVDRTQRIQVSFPDTVATGRLMLYRQSRDGWDALPGHIERGKLESGLIEFGSFAVMDDAVAPTIRMRHPAEGEAPTSRRPRIRAEITDKGSGIDRFSATFNGQWLLMEYDPEQDLLTWEQDEDLPAGGAKLVIEITDRAGNVAREEVLLQIPN